MSVENTFILYISFFVISFLFMYQSYYYDQIGENIYITRGVSKSSLFTTLSFLTLLALIIFRNGVGTDYPRYQELFYSIHRNSLNSIEVEWLRGSILYWAICKVITAVTLNPYIMFGVMGFITLLFFYLGLCKSDNKKEALYLFFCCCIYFQIFNQVRQMVAVSMVFYSFYYYKNGEIKKFIVLILCAMGFHLSAGTVLILLFVRNVKIRFRSLINYLLIAAIGYSLLSLFINIFNFIPYISNYSYLFNSSNAGTNINLIVRIVLLFACLILHGRTIERDENSDRLYNIVIICTILQLFATKFPIIGRVTTFFFVAYIYLIPEILGSIRTYFKNNALNRMTIQIAFIIAFFCYFLVYYFSPTGSGAISGNYISYKFFWQ